MIPPPSHRTALVAGLALLWMLAAGAAPGARAQDVTFPGPVPLSNLGIVQTALTVPWPGADFRYLADEDVYICPAGERLRYRYTNEERGLTLRRYWTNSCQNCPIKQNCTTGKERRITRWEHEHLVDAMRERLSGNDDPMNLRRSTVEHPFGTIKAWMGVTHFQMRRLRNAVYRVDRNGALDANSPIEGPAPWPSPACHRKADYRNRLNRVWNIPVSSARGFRRLPIWPCMRKRKTPSSKA